MITVVALEDWQVVYDAEGKKVAEGHRISGRELLELAGVEHDWRDLHNTAFDAEVCETGGTPEHVSEVPEA